MLFSHVNRNFPYVQVGFDPCYCTNIIMKTVTMNILILAEVSNKYRTGMRSLVRIRLYGICIPTEQ